MVLMVNRFDRTVGSKKTVVSSGTGKKPAEHWRLVDRSSYQVTQAGPDAVSKLSHDIRTQLYIIIGFAELMLQEIPGKINEEQRRNLNDVLNSGKRLLDLLQDIVVKPENKSGLGKGG